MGLQLLDYIVLVGYFVVVAAIGFIATRLIRNREDFLMGGRRFGKAMMIMFAFGAGTHADSAVGVASQSYKFGLSGIWYQWVMVFTLPIYWLLAPIFRRARCLTTADFFERRFGRPMMYVYSVFALFVMLSFNGVMFYGAAKVVEALTDGKIDYRLAIVLMAIVSFAYGIAGGLIAAVWNDFLQGMLTIVMSLLIIPFFWQKVGGLHGFQQRILESNHPNAAHVFDLVLSSDMTVYWIVMMSISSLISMVAQPQILASTAAAKSEMDSRIGFVGGMILKRLMTIPWALTGVMAIALYGYSATADPDHTFGKMSADLLPVGCVGLMLACVMASVMDNCAVNMLSFAGIWTNSIHQRLIAPHATESQLVLVNRITSVVFAIISIILAFLFTDMPAAMRFLWQTVPLMGIAWFFAILWRRANRWGAIASFFAALGATALAKFVLPDFEVLGIKVTWAKDAGLPFTITLYVLAGIGAGIIVSLLTRPEDPVRTEQFFLLLKTPIGQEHVLREAGFREVPGRDTFELPIEDAPPRRGFEVITEPSLAQSVCGNGHAATTATATATLAAPVTAAAARLDNLPQAAAKIDNTAARRQSIAGFIVLTGVVVVMLVSVRLLAQWLAP
ncbi:sodium:solute symporter family protein [Fontivita pretiosa]|uniref:sodium:solute symporter family protein n=1 Tax=Fontivita pretiosa TaxID=2989684 RepID=UPI003D183848